MCHDTHFSNLFGLDALDFDFHWLANNTSLFVQSNLSKPKVYTSLKTTSFLHTNFLSSCSKKIEAIIC